MNNMLLALPEIFLAASGLLLLLVTAFAGDKFARMAMWSTLSSFVLTAALICWFDTDGVALNNMFANDAFRRFAKITILLASGLTLSLSPSFFSKGQGAKPEFSILVLFSTLGMLLMTSAHDLIALYVGLELQNLPLYVLAASQRDSMKSSEAGVKYFSLGALSSAILLFGLSLIYGFTGVTDYADLATLVTSESAQAPGLAMGIAFLLAGFAFKISVAPFHMWTPDVYDGAPLPVTSFLAAAPKVAAFALVVCVLFQPFAQAALVWRPILVALSVASMLIGSFAGLAQTSIKRLMAYSAIANMGTILVGVVSFDSLHAAQSAGAVQGVLLYLVFYSLGTIGVFAVLHTLSRHEKALEQISDLSGLSKEHPYAAFALGVALFSLAGVPPLAGFFGKYFVLISAVQSGLVWLAVLGVMASVVAAVYYLRLIKIMYFDEPKGLPFSLVSEKLPRVVAGLAALVLLVFILVPAPLVEIARQAGESLILP